MKLVIGAGPVGRAVTRQLLDAGHEVTVATRSGTTHPGAWALAIDAADRAATQAAIRGADAVYHCAHTAYTVGAFRRDLPRAEASVLAAAAQEGVVVVFPESLYAFGDSTVIDAATPLAPTTGMGAVRAELLRRRAASPAPTVSVAAADFFGPGVVSSIPTAMVIDRVRAGRRPLAYLRRHVPHSLTYVPDLARAMIVAAATPALHGRLTLAPTWPAMTQEGFARLAQRVAGRPHSRAVRVPVTALRAAAPFHPAARAMLAASGQWLRPLHVRPGEAFGFHPTPPEEALDRTLAAGAWETAP